MEKANCVMLRSVIWLMILQQIVLAILLKKGLKQFEKKLSAEIPLPLNMESELDEQILKARKKCLREPVRIILKQKSLEKGV